MCSDIIPKRQGFALILKIGIHICITHVHGVRPKSYLGTYIDMSVFQRAIRRRAL